MAAAVAAVAAAAVDCSTASYIGLLKSLLSVVGGLVGGASYTNQIIITK